MKSYLLLNAKIVNEGSIQEKDVFIKDGLINTIGNNLSALKAEQVIDAKGQYLLPGVIDDQVHFREPGLCHKATIQSEARAAVAGGTTSFMEMPNTVPNTLTQELLEEKYQMAARSSLANYSFYMGASNDNLSEVLKTNPNNVCGIKAFMGSSTGNMLVDKIESLEALFSKCSMLIATHCEDEKTIRQRTEHYKSLATKNVQEPYLHAIIRNEEACFLSSSLAVSLAQKYNSRLHILHISTQKEISLFSNTIPLSEKKITSEVSVNHLWYDTNDYQELGNQIKCNPSIKYPSDRISLLEALQNDTLDIIATDHAPHTWEEKNSDYWNAPSGIPSVQHSLQMLLEMYQQKKISIEKVVQKMSHAPADCFKIEKRGYIREGYWADLVLVDLNSKQTVKKENIFYQCQWTPLLGKTFHSKITHTFVSGHLAYQNNCFDDSKKGQRLSFIPNN